MAWRPLAGHLSSCATTSDFYLKLNINRCAATHRGPSTSDRVVIEYQGDLRERRLAASMNEITLRPSVFIAEKDRTNQGIHLQAETQNNKICTSPDICWR